MTNPLITVVMPAYNREQYIADAIESILNQSYQHFELIIVDDCSTDNTVSVIKQFDDRRIRLIEHEQKSGVAAARNTGYANSRGEFIAISDSDDINHTDRLLKQIEFLINNPQIDVVACWKQVIDEHNKLGNVIKFDISNEQIRANWIFNPGVPAFMMFRKQKLENENLLYHDTSFKAAVDYQWYADLNEHIQIACIPEVLYYYRRHYSQISTSGFSTQQDYANLIRIKQLAYIDIHPSDEELQLHRKLIYDFAEEVDQSLFDAMVRWCEKLQAANETKKHFEIVCFNRVLARHLLKVINREQIYSLAREKQLQASTLGEYIENDGTYTFSLNAQLLKHISNEVMIFGTKKMGVILKEMLEQEGKMITNFIDNNQKVHDKMIGTSKIVSPGDIYDANKSTVVISIISKSKYIVKDQLVQQYGYDPERIYTLDDLI